MAFCDGDQIVKFVIVERPAYASPEIHRVLARRFALTDSVNRDADRTRRHECKQYENDIADPPLECSRTKSQNLSCSTLL